MAIFFIYDKCHSRNDICQFFYDFCHLKVVIEDTLQVLSYLVLVSHGEFAAGLKTSLMMLAGQRDDVIASGLPDGKTADEFAEIFKESVKDIHEDDEIVLLADIVGGSPLTTALNVLAEKGLMEKTTTIGGMNLPLALTSVLMKDTLQGDSFVQAVLSEATTALQEFKVVEDDEDDI